MLSVPEALLKAISERLEQQQLFQRAWAPFAKSTWQLTTQQSVALHELLAKHTYTSNK